MFIFDISNQNDDQSKFGSETIECFFLIKKQLFLCLLNFSNQNTILFVFFKIKTQFVLDKNDDQTRSVLMPLNFLALRSDL